jgi:hypothetical protein
MYYMNLQNTQGTANIVAHDSVGLLRTSMLTCWDSQNCVICHYSNTAVSRVLHAECFLTALYPLIDKSPPAFFSTIQKHF